MFSVWNCYLLPRDPI
uniref:Uncharacterized protein n=1 Tax=Arundo donax TaxID=35708 RepID=A0A0A9GAU6_ARUDO